MHISHCSNKHHGESNQFGGHFAGVVLQLEKTVLDSSITDTEEGVGVAVTGRGGIAAE